MSHDPEIHRFLLRHLEAIRSNDLAEYRATTHPDLTLYEWWVTPHRIEGLPFHEFIMAEQARLGASFGAVYDASTPPEARRTRFDLANLKIQRYGDTAVASYTLLVSSGQSAGVAVSAHHESRIIARIDDRWQVVHVHKSPAWHAPYQSG